MLEWLQNPVIAIGLAVGAMFFGYFFGLFEGRGQGYKRRKAEERDEVEQQEPEAKAEPTPLAAPVLPPDKSSLLNVSKDNSGGLYLDLDGQRIEAAAMSSEQRKRIIAVLTQVRPWLESPTPVPPPAQPAPTPAARSTGSPRSVSPPVTMEGDEPVAAPQSIVAQIDAILHTQLTGTPLMEKGIRLQESPEGGVIVWVGIKKYQGLDEVPDEQIKTAIRAAISTWENKYTPGI